MLDETSGWMPDTTPVSSRDTRKETKAAGKAVMKSTQTKTEKLPNCARPKPTTARRR